MPRNGPSGFAARLRHVVSTEPEQAIHQETATPARHRKAIITAAMAALWTIWGSTYLAIRYGIETMPPYFMQFCRFVAASLIMLVIVRRTGKTWPPRNQVRNACIVGLMLIIGGVGMVTLAEQRGVDTGLIATLIAIQPMLVALWGGIWGSWPRRIELAGMAIGLVGVLVLMSDDGLNGTSTGIALVLFACFNWSLGSAVSRHIEMPPPTVSTFIQMVAAMVGFLALSLISGETMTMPSLRSGLAVAYLAVFGSVVAFSAFTYLLANVRASLAMSYAYVNPLIAVLLGTVLASERINVHLLVALPIILAGVALVTNAERLKNWRPTRR